MPESLAAGIVRLLKPDGTTAGTGFVITNNGLIATGAHVVEGIGVGLGCRVTVAFRGGEKRQAAVDMDSWRASDAEDVAILRLEGGLPGEAHILSLGPSAESKGHSFETFGFPEASPEDGILGAGEILGETTIKGLRVLQLRSSEITPGFSGAPVLDAVTGRVIGMVAAITAPDSYGRLSETAFCVPIETLVATCPDLAQFYLDAQMKDLRIRRDRADQERRVQRERRRVVNLRPLDVTHTFKDRTREVQSLCKHLSDPAVRLVSVVGRGGMGKTALVSHVLADLEDGKASAVSVDGILYLSARSTGLGLERVYADVGRLLGEPAAGRLAARWVSGETPLAAKVEYLLETLQDGLYVILLDNLEDILTEGGDIADEGLRLFVKHCLAQPGGVRLVVTSRKEVRLPAAALPGTRCIPLRDGLPEDDAIALLRDLDPQGELNLHNAPEGELRRAAQFTQGVPRALELLAGILHEDPTLRLSDLLGDARLFGEQVVERLVAEGHRLLSEPERRVMEALAVFDRPVEATAVAYLLHSWYPGLDVRAALRRLARSYFVSVDRASGEYSLHPLDREYAYGQLPDGEAAAYTRRNLELQAAEFYAHICKPQSEWETLDDLVPKLAEFEHYVRAGDYDDAFQILELIDYGYLHLWGHYARLVEMRKTLRGGLMSPQLQAANSGSLGRAYRALGWVESAIRLYEEALDFAQQAEDRQMEGARLGSLGNAYLELWQIELAAKFYKDALIIARDEADRAEEGRHLGNLGLLHYLLGEVEVAIGYYEKALFIAREIGHRRREGGRLGNLGNAYFSLGQIDQAIEYFKCALAIARELGNRREEGVQLCNLGNAYHSLGHVEKAILRYQEALATAQEIGYRSGEQRYLSNLGGAYHVLEQFEQAISHYKEALVIAREISDRRGESYQLLGIGQSLLATGELVEAQQHCAEARALNVPETSYRAALMLGIVLLYQLTPGVRETFTDTVTRCQAMLDKAGGLYGPRYALASALVGVAVCAPGWADVGARADLLAPALEEYRRALEITAAPGIVGDALRDLKLIRAAGIEGLEPVFELLENVEYEPNLTEDLLGILEEIE